MENVYDIYELDEKLQGNLRKAPKLIYKVIHPRNVKQDVSLALAIFDETILAAIKSCYPNRLDAANFLNIFHKLFVICNSKQQFHTSNMLGNDAIADYNKPPFLDYVANWVKNWVKIGLKSLHMH